ncbi:MAG: hypothetical protein O7A67_09690, partial [SAR324 cluster bacterium]|nr:hypothetical protein [SAR324 cluster bacterium]
MRWTPALWVIVAVLLLSGCTMLLGGPAGWVAALIGLALAVAAGCTSSGGGGGGEGGTVTVAVGEATEG